MRGLIVEAVLRLRALAAPQDRVVTEQESALRAGLWGSMVASAAVGVGIYPLLQLLGLDSLRATVAGVVADVRAQPGQRVEAGQPLICVEAMKMEMWLTATATGRVAGLHVQVRDAVPAGALLVELEIDP